MLLGPGVFSLSTAVIFVKLSDLPPAALASGRLLLGAALLVPFMLVERRRPGGAALLARARRTLPAAALLAAHFVVWFVGVRLTTAANATLVVNLSPVAMPFALYLLVGERVTRREIAGTALAVAGVGALAAGSARLEAGGLAGDLVCVAGMVLAVGYLVLARRNNRPAEGAAEGAAGGPVDIFGYLVPLYAMAGLITAAWALATGEAAAIVAGSHNWPREALLVVALALIPTAIGHSVLNYAMIHLRGQLVAVASLGQVVFATLLAVPVLGEVPAWPFYPACALIGAGALVVILRPRSARAQRGG